MSLGIRFVEVAMATPFFSFSELNCKVNVKPDITQVKASPEKPGRSGFPQLDWLYLSLLPFKRIHSMCSTRKHINTNYPDKSAKHVLVAYLLFKVFLQATLRA